MDGHLFHRVRVRVRRKLKFRKPGGQAGRGMDEVDTHNQRKVGVRDLAGRGVRAGKRCHQLTVGVRDRTVAGRGGGGMRQSHI